ncbi:MAG: hypothetical protein WCG07_00805 [Candidatus Taylorbacteria bacterium]
MVTNTQALETRFNGFISRETPWAFFTGLGDYIRYALTIPAFKSVINAQFDIERAHYKAIDDVENQTLKELDVAKKDLLKIIKERKVDVKTFVQGMSSIPSAPGQEEDMLERLEKFESGEISVGGFHSDYLNLFLFDIAANLLRLGYKDDVEKYLVSDKEYSRYFARINGPQSNVAFGRNTRGNFIFSKTWPERFEKTRAMEAAREIEPWGAFEAILKFYRAQQVTVKDGGAMWTFTDCLTDPEFPFIGKDAVDIYYASNDLRALAKHHKSQDDQLKYLHVEDLRTRVSTVHFHLMQAAMTDDGVTDMKRRAMTEALHQKQDEAWKAVVNDFMKRTEAFMERYSEQKQDEEGVENGVVGGRWWKDSDLPSFSEKNGKITLGQRKCQIPLDAVNQIVTCKAIFSKPLELWTEEIEVLHDFYKGEDSKRGLKDATRAINRRAKEVFGIIELLKYSGRSRRVRLNTELFEQKKV